MNNNSAVEVNVHHEYVALSSSTRTTQIPRVWFLLRAPSAILPRSTSRTAQSCSTEQGKLFNSHTFLTAAGVFLVQFDPFFPQILFLPGHQIVHFPVIYSSDK